MSLYQKASLVQIPSGYKASSAKLYSVIPSSGDGDFTVSSDTDATRVNAEGLIEDTAANQARLNYDFDNPQDPHLLLEPTRTNQISKSRDLEGWQDLGGSETVTNNDATAPNGANTAATIEKTGSDNTTLRFYTTYTNYSTVRSASIYIKKLSGSPTVSFGITDTQDSITPTDEWVRYTKDNVTPSDFGVPIFVDIEVSGVSGDKIAVWGAQLEEGTYSTSVIETTGSEVTRTVDYASGAGNSTVFNDSEGTLFIDAAALGDDGTYRIINISDGTTDNRVVIQLGNNNNQITGDLISGGVTQTTLTTTSYTFTDFNKIALKYKADDTALFVNGTQVGSTQTGRTMPTGLDRIDFQNGNLGSTFYFRGKLKQLMYFDTALSDAELITLTS